jgi:hypothetical protein
MTFRIALLLCLIVAPSAVLAQARIYYDPAKGDDANPGTQEKPVKTFDKADSLLTGAGQIISPIGVTTYTSARRFKIPGTK